MTNNLTRGKTHSEARRYAPGRRTSQVDSGRISTARRPSSCGALDHHTSQSIFSNIYEKFFQTTQRGILTNFLQGNYTCIHGTGLLTEAPQARKLIHRRGGRRGACQDFLGVILHFDHSGPSTHAGCTLSVQTLETRSDILQDI